MNNSAYFLLFIGSFAIISIVIFGQLKKVRKNQQVKFTKLDLNKCDAGLLTCTELKKEVGHLIENGYHLTSKTEIFDFVYHRTKLSEKSVVIIMDDNAFLKVRSILPFLLTRNINVILFMPFILTM